jgi:hypothetical protein
VLGAAANLNSQARTLTVYTPAFNNGATAVNTNNAATSIVNHYGFSYGITTGNSAADTYSLTYTTTQMTGCAVAMVSFRLPPTGAVAMSAITTLLAQPYYPPPLVGQGPFTSASGTTITPALPRPNPDTGNLMVALVYASNPPPGPPAGWTGVVGAGNSDNVRIFWTIATPGITNPTFLNQASGQMYAQVLEFSGMMAVPAGAGAPTQDQSAYITNLSTSPATATAATVDAAPANELVIALGYGFGSTATVTTGLSSNNAPINVTGNNDTASAGQHVAFGYGQATSNSSPTSVSFTNSLAGSTNAVYLATFKPKTWANQLTTVVSQGLPTGFVGGLASPLFLGPTTAGNLLVAMAYGGSSIALNTNPGGWVAGRASASGHIGIWYRPNCGANETPPTFILTPSGVVTLMEVAGVVTSSPYVDQSAAATGTSGFTTVVNPAPEQHVGELIVGVFGCVPAGGSMTAPTFTMGIQTSGGGGPVTTIQTGANGPNAWGFGYFVSQSNANPSYQQSAPNGTPTGPNTDVIISSFLAPSGPPIDVGSIAMSGTAGMTVIGALPIADLTDAFTTLDTTKWTPSDANIAVI